jgi:DNA-binding Lrp family transcriptional regulator
MRLKVLHALQQQPDLNQRQLAVQLGVSLGKTNYLLRALVDKGLLKACNFRNSENKRARTEAVRRIRRLTSWRAKTPLREGIQRAYAAASLFGVSSNASPT